MAGAALTITRPRFASGAAAHPEELSAAQRAAVMSDARLVVVQGGPGAGKTEAAVARIVRLTTQLRQDSAWLLALVPSETQACSFRSRLARALAAAGCREAEVERTTACVLPRSAFDVVRLTGEAGEPVAPWPPDVLARAASVGDELAPTLGLGRHLEEARHLVLETMRFLAREAGSGRAPDSSASDGDWFRRGVALVEETVRFAQLEVLRRLRALEGTPGWIGDLGRQLRRPADVAQRARDLRSAVDRALRYGTSDRAELERLRSWVDVAAIDLAEASRREAAAAGARRRLWEASRTLLGDLGIASDDGFDAVSSAAPGGLGDSLSGAARHVIVDDAHDLASGEMEHLRRATGGASLFVTGDQRGAWHDGIHSTFRALLREAGRAVVLLEAPRFGAGVGRFVNALGSRLWPSSEPGGYAPAIVRLDSDPVAAAPVELWLARRHMRAGPDGADHPESIADARAREARAVAEGVRRMLGGTRYADTVVLAQDDCGRALIVEALEREGVGAGVVDVLTVDECQGLEWSTVFVTGLDEPLGGPAPRRAWVDAETGLAVVWPVDGRGRRVWPFSSLLLARRAAAVRDASARQRLFFAAARARTRLILTGVTREKAAGGGTCVAPVEWLRRQLGVADLAQVPPRCRMGEAEVRVRVVDLETSPPT